MKKYLIFSKYEQPDDFFLKEIHRLKKGHLNKITLKKLQNFLMHINDKNLVHHRLRKLRDLYPEEIPIEKTPQYVKDFSKLLKLGTPGKFSELKYFSREPKRRKFLVFEESELHETIPTNCHGKALWTIAILKTIGIPARIREGFYYMDFLKKYVIHEKPEFFFENKWHKIEVDNLGPHVNNPEPHKGEFVGVEDLDKIDEKKIALGSFNSVQEIFDYTKQRDRQFLENKPTPVYQR